MNNTNEITEMTQLSPALATTDTCRDCTRDPDQYVLEAHRSFRKVGPVSAIRRLTKRNTPQ